MAEMVRRLIRQDRVKDANRHKLSGVFSRFFGERHGIDSLPRGRSTYRPL